MKRLIFSLIILMALILSTQYAKADEWTRTDTALQVAYTTVHVIDWMQTLDIKNHSNMYETNNILGKHPQDASIHAYFAGTLIGHTLVGYYLPTVLEYVGVPNHIAKYSRNIWQCVWFGIETDTIVHNYSMGIKAHF